MPPWVPCWQNFGFGSAAAIVLASPAAAFIAGPDFGLTHSACLPPLERLSMMLGGAGPQVRHFS